MKKIFLSIVVLFSVTIYGQVTKDLGDFTKVTAFDKISVKLIPSNENKIVYKGKFENEAETIMSNNELKIRLPLGSFLKGDDLVATVYFKKLEAVEANEGSYLSCDSGIQAVDFELIAKEGAQIKINVNAQRITARASQGAEIKIEGKTETIAIITNSGGKVAAEKCISKQATVALNAGGSVDVYATELADVKTRAGGNILIYGNPKQVNQKKVLGGNIKIIKN